MIKKYKVSFHGTVDSHTINDTLEFSGSDADTIIGKIRMAATNGTTATFTSIYGRILTFNFQKIKYFNVCVSNED